MTIETARSFYRRMDWSPSYGHKVKGQGRLVTVTTPAGREMVNVEASIKRYEATKDPAKGYMAQVNEGQRKAAGRTKAAPAPAPGTKAMVAKKVQAVRAPAGRPPPAPPPQPPAEDGDSDGGGSGMPAAGSYMQARTHREQIAVSSAMLDLKVKRGLLIAVAEVRSHLAGKIATMREAFLQIPSRVVPILAAETDQAKIHQLLEDEISRAMALVTEGDANAGR